jgi:ABC-type sulfate transport system permease subunit
MLKKLYVLFGIGVILLYATSSWFGWEFANSGRKSVFGVPFIYTGFRGGK